MHILRLIVAAEVVSSMVVEKWQHSAWTVSVGQRGEVVADIRHQAHLDQFFFQRGP